MASTEVITLSDDEESNFMDFQQLSGIPDDSLEPKQEVQDPEECPVKEEPVESGSEVDSPQKKRKKTRRRASSDSDEEYRPGGSADSGDDDDYNPREEEFFGEDMEMGEYTAGPNIDDNDTKAYNRRIFPFESVEVPPDSFIITRMVTSEEHGNSKNPWRVDSATWDRLHDYQKTGVQWLQRKTDHRSGGILADQMGLGKTIQAAVYLRSIAETGRAHYKTSGLDICLIVCNVSVLAQWIKALNEWFPKLRVFLLHSHCSTGRQEDYVEQMFFKLRNRSREYPHGAVILTTYGIFTKYHRTLTRQIWQVVILDEGHYIRNEKTKCSQAMKKLISTQRFILTGTPFQNKLSEFWKLVDFVYPGRLSDSATFHRNFVQIINAGANLRCSPQAAAKAYECLVALHRAVKPLILRRLQEDHKEVLNLPEKDDKVYSCELSDRQRRLYEDYLASGQVSQILAGKMMSFCGLQKLGDICNHPGLYRKVSVGSKKFGGIKDSGKVEMTFKLLKEWFKDPVNRVIFFTQRKGVIEMMKHFLTQKGIQYVSLTGSDNAAARPKIIKKFEDDLNIKIFLMTTRAGGLGLNLTQANKVIIFDPDWNPAADNQAKDRCYRMGQTNNVSIVRLISNGTLEDRIYMKQVQKEMLAAQLLHNADVAHSVPNNSVADLFRLKPKGIEGSDIGLYLPGEIAKGSNQDSSQEKDKKAKKKEKKRMKNKLAGFEDKQLLLSLFDDEKLVAMRQHSIAVQNSATMNRMEKIEMRNAVDMAVGSLLHTEGRLAHTWKQEFHKQICSADPKKQVVSDYFVENEELDSYWNTVHNGFRANNDQRELDRLVQIAKNMVTFLNGVPGASEKKLHRIFVTEKDKMKPTQMYFIQEILSTVAKYDDEEKHWVLRSKYRNVQFVEQRKRVILKNFDVEKEKKKQKMSPEPGTST